MKACMHKRKLIVGLAFDALEADQARELRRHIESCTECRDYLAEISRLNSQLRVAEGEPGIEATEAFHQRVMRAVRAEETRSWWSAIATYPGGMRFSWRVGVPGLGALAVALVMWLTLAPHPNGRLEVSMPSPAPSSPEPDAVLPPSVANYRVAANRSLEQLDELLNQQANRRVSTRQVYTASVAALDTRLPD